MNIPMTLEEVALKIARVAAATTDQATARQLLNLINEMLSPGLPDLSRPH